MIGFQNTHVYHKRLALKHEHREDEIRYLQKTKAQETWGYIVISAKVDFKNMIYKKTQSIIMIKGINTRKIEYITFLSIYAL